MWSLFNQICNVYVGECKQTTLGSPPKGDRVPKPTFCAPTTHVPRQLTQFSNQVTYHSQKMNFQSQPHLPLIQGGGGKGTISSIMPSTLCPRKITQLWNGIAWNCIDRFGKKYSKDSRIDFRVSVYMQVCLLSRYRLSNCITKIMHACCAF